MRLDHLALTVSDRRRSAALRDPLRRTVRVHEDDHLLILGSEDGGALLALTEGAPAAAALPRTNHFGFRMQSGDEVRAARKRLREQAVDETEWQDDGAFVRVHATDPDGYRVKL